MARHIFPENNAWQRDTENRLRYKIDTCAICGVVRKAIINPEFSLLPYYRYMPPNSKKDRFVSTFYGCNVNKYNNKSQTRIKEESGPAIIIPKKKLIGQRPLTEVEAQLKDCIMIIKLLVMELFENKLTDAKAYGIGIRLLESKGLKDWIDELNNLTK